MITVEVPEAQVIEWIRQLSPVDKRAVLDALIPHLDRLDFLVDYGTERMRHMCAERGLDWDALGEGERERLIDDLLHENWLCPSGSSSIRTSGAFCADVARFSS